jgi:iron complex outermembrane receptor protein
MGIALVSVAAKAQAQTTASAEAADRQAQSSATLSEVIVTAQRRSQRLEEVPISVTALAGEDLDKLGIRNLRDLQTVVPSFLMSSSGVFTQLAIRGVTSTALGPGIENNIAVYVDGIYEPDSSALGSDFANVTAVQVLKGPQGTLYGRNATGGALLVNTYEPSADHPIIEASAGYGNLNDRRFRTYLGVPVAKGLSVGVGAYYRANDGYVKNINGSDAAKFSETDIRVKLKWDPTDTLSFILGYNYFYKSDPLTGAFTELAYSPLGLPVGPLFTNQIDHVSMDPNPVFTVLMNETTFRAKWTTDYGTFTSHTAYTDERPHFDNDWDGTMVHAQQIPATFVRHTFIQQLDYYVKPIDELEIQAGGLYFKDQSSNEAEVYLTLPPVLPTFSLFQHTNVAMRTTAYAGYVDATWEAIPHLFLNAGVRYSKDERTVFGYYIDAASFIKASTPSYPILAPTTSASFPATTPRATIRYEFAPRSNVYFSYSKGFKSGTFNTVGANVLALTTPVQPEHVTAYEVGFKTAQGPYRFETAAFYYDYKNLQVNALTTDPTSGRILVLLANAAAARIWGLEASGAWAVTPDFNLRAGLAYTNARYQSFPAASVALPYPTNNPTSVVTAVPPGGMPGISGAPGSPLTEDFSGLRIARAPDWTANIGGDYTIPLSVGKLLIAGNVAYTSAYAPLSEAYNPITGAPYYYNDGYVLANASMDWIIDKYTVGVWVNDIGNTRFPIVNQADSFGYRKVLSSPRTFGVRVNYAY